MLHVPLLRCAPIGGLALVRDEAEDRALALAATLVSLQVAMEAWGRPARRTPRARRPRFRRAPPPMALWTPRP